MLKESDKWTAYKLYYLGYADVYSLSIMYKCSTTEIEDALRDCEKARME